MPGPSLDAAAPVLCIQLHAAASADFDVLEAALTATVGVDAPGLDGLVVASLVRSVMSSLERNPPEEVFWAYVDRVMAPWPPHPVLSREGVGAVVVGVYEPDLARAIPLGIRHGASLMIITEFIQARGVTPEAFLALVRDELGR